MGGIVCISIYIYIGIDVDVDRYIYGEGFVIIMYKEL